MKIKFAIVGLVMSIVGMARAQDKTTPPSFEKLAKTYDYDAKKPLGMKETPQADIGITVLRLTFSGANGKSVPGLFLRPKGDKKVPCVLLLHGLGSKKEDMVGSFGNELVKNGYAVLALDAPFHGERKPKDDGKGNSQARFQMQFLETIQEGVRDWRRGVDYLETRKDVDIKRLGLIGYSMGSMMGSIFAAVDDRVKASAFCVGGDPILPMAKAMGNPMAYSISPSLFVGHIAPRPVLFINGKKDTTMLEVAAKLLIDAAQKPKEVIWVDAGHILPPKDAQQAVTWIEKTLGK